MHGDQVIMTYQSRIMLLYLIGRTVTLIEVLSVGETAVHCCNFSWDLGN